jgi:hypothetical protein
MKRVVKPLERHGGAYRGRAQGEYRPWRFTAADSSRSPTIPPSPAPRSSQRCCWRDFLRRSDDRPRTLFVPRPYRADAACFGARLRTVDKGVDVTGRPRLKACDLTSPAISPRGFFHGGRLIVPPIGTADPQMSASIPPVTALSRRCADWGGPAAGGRAAGGRRAGGRCFWLAAAASKGSTSAAR